MADSEVLIGQHIFTSKTVKIEVQDSRIVGVREQGHSGGQPAQHWLGPGLVDLQVNGYAGIDFNATPVSVEDMGALCLALLLEGVTQFLPTVVTAQEREMTTRLAAIARAISEEPLAARMVTGIHVEGPFLDPSDGPRGAHPQKSIRPPSLDELDRWQEACGGIVRVLTLSPHWPSASQFITAVTKAGIRVAIGHTNATADQIDQAIQAGATLSTHLGNGISQTIDRHRNPIWPQLADDRLFASLIADGFHLPTPTLASFIKAKGIQRSILVSDSVALSGCPPGVYQQHIGGEVELSPDGALRMRGTRYLAGAARPLQAGVATLVNALNQPLSLGWTLAASNPRCFLGQTPRTLKVGEPADIVQFSHKAGDTQLTISNTLLGGKAHAH